MKKTAPTRGVLTAEDRELLRICAPFKKWMLDADRFAREVRTRSGVAPTLSPDFRKWGAGLSLRDMAVTLGPYAFFWPPFWNRLRMCRWEASNPDDTRLVEKYAEGRAASNSQRREMEKVFTFWLSRAGVRKPKKDVKWEALRAERTKLSGNHLKKWDEQKARELGYKDRDSFTREMRKHRPKKA